MAKKRDSRKKRKRKLGEVNAPNNDRPTKVIKREKKDATITYTRDQQILVLGDGDFTFSLALASNLGSGRNMVCTSYDKINGLIRKYENARQNLVKLKAMGATVRHGVDAKNLSNSFGKRSFDRIIFNFPHTGEQRVHLNRELLERFFGACVPFSRLRPPTEIHVALKNHTPYTNWNIDLQAAKHGIIQVRKVLFRARDYKGYEHRTTLADAETFDASNSYVHVFQLKPSIYAKLEQRKEELKQQKARAVDDHKAPQTSSPAAHAPVLFCCDPSKHSGWQAVTFTASKPRVILRIPPESCLQLSNASLTCAKYKGHGPDHRVPIMINSFVAAYVTSKITQCKLMMLLQDTADEQQLELCVPGIPLDAQVELAFLCYLP